MKANKISIIVTVLSTTAFLLLSFLLVYCIDTNSNNKEFISLMVNISIGAFASSLLALIISLINYFSLRKNYISEYVTMINCFSILFRPYYNLYLENSNRNIEVEDFYIQQWFDYLLSNLHKPTNQLYFFFEKNKTQKIIDETNKILTDIYIGAIKVLEAKSKYNFELISLSDYDQVKIKFFNSINESGNIPTVNILTDNFDKIIKINKLSYIHRFDYKDL